MTALILALLLLSSCSFDYGDMGENREEQPDIVMKDVEYVRVRGGEPQVRFRAEGAERYENQQTMELRNFSFEQFNPKGTDVSAIGRAGSAHVELDSGNIHMDQGVRIDVESEDITIETREIRWRDKERILAAGEGEQVEILRPDGTNFLGRGFSADVRNRTWIFSGGIEGTYVHEDEEEETPEPEAEEEAGTSGAGSAGGGVVP
ncbi:MAG: LPS export ABC transporter periplasmic protein LptC [Treponema sp.]|jgi:LPS export ABC transporter protein LptC|nr:LPS export ABC transporter periplasmic protein LptC [Treponema sp.]